MHLVLACSGAWQREGRAVGSGVMSVNGPGKASVLTTSE